MPDERPDGPANVSLVMSNSRWQRCVTSGMQPIQKLFFSSHLPLFSRAIPSQSFSSSLSRWAEKSEYGSLVLSSERGWRRKNTSRTPLKEISLSEVKLKLVTMGSHGRVWKPRL